MSKKTSILTACFALLALSGVFCGFWLVNVENSALADTPTATTPSDKAPSLEHAVAMRHWLVLVGALLLLFLFSLILFRTLGRRLAKRRFRAHAPTPHADIWASHKPPESFDP